MSERDYYLAFSLVNGIGPKTFKTLLKSFQTAQKAWNMPSKNLKKAGFTDNFIAKFEKAKSEINVQDYKEKLKHKKASFIALCDKNYPKLLAKIDNPPIVLFFKGNLSSLISEKTVGVVGTRKITSYGQDVTKLFSQNLSSIGFTIVSGMAMGVDAVAAWSAIDVGGKTVAVLGNGVDLAFPTTNEKLYDKILESGGAIVSEFPLGASPTMGSFPSRNRIIAGLSLGVLVTEGAEDSGSLITADYAFKFKRAVFAVPGPITSKLSVAPLKLIEKGAKLVTSAEDIARQLNVQIAIKTSKPVIDGLSKEEIKVVQILENENLSFDEIVQKLGSRSSETGTLLSLMEIKGIIVKNSGGRYSIGL